MFTNGKKFSVKQGGQSKKICSHRGRKEGKSHLRRGDGLGNKRMIFAVG